MQPSHECGWVGSVGSAPTPECQAQGQCHRHPLVFVDSPAGLSPGQVDGIFAGWRPAVSPSGHLSLLRGSDAPVLAADRHVDRVMAFASVTSDDMVCARITLLEVLLAYGVAVPDECCGGGS